MYWTCRTCSYSGGTTTRARYKRGRSSHKRGRSSHGKTGERGGRCGGSGTNGRATTAAARNTLKCNGMSRTGSTGSGGRNATTCGATSYGATRYSGGGSGRSGNRKYWTGSYSGRATRNVYGVSTSWSGRYCGTTPRSAGSGGSRNGTCSRDWSSTGQGLGRSGRFLLLILKGVAATKVVAGVGRVRSQVGSC